MYTGFDRGFAVGMTQATRRVMARAVEEAQRLGREELDTEHLLLALLQENAPIVERTLSHFHAEPEQLRAALEQLAPPVAQVHHQEIRLTPQARQVLDLAFNEARQQNDRDLGPEYLLLGLLRLEAGGAWQVLEGARLRLDKTRAAVRMSQQIQQGQETDSNTGSG